jgi:hypothetical protein
MRSLVALLLSVAAAAADAQVLARVVASDPPAEATLGRHQPFYVRIKFDAEEPVSLWARPYLGGKPIEKGVRTNASARHAGSGHALGWFSFDGVAEVDEVRILAGGGKPYREWIVAAQPVKLRWTAQPGTGPANEPWVGELQRETERAWREARQAEASGPVTVGGAAFMSVFMAAVLVLLVASIGAPAWALWKWRGGWRVAAAVPALLMAFVVLRIIVDVGRDPTSHNLWPLEILMFGAASVAIILVLAFVRRFISAEPR